MRLARLGRDAFTLLAGVAMATSGAALTSTTASAQSAADVATARHLATQGIEAFGIGDYESALDRIGRAQALYDAPVHRLYLARSLHKLGRLIEASEMYRKLVRTQLGPQAPKAFRRAVKDGRRELAALEPKIPSITIHITPEKIGSLDLRIDGEPVAAAVVGIARLVDPGTHEIRATAPALAVAEATVTVEEGENKSVDLSLVPENQRGEGEDEVPVAPAPEPPPKAAPEPMDTDESSGGMSFFAGLRLGAALPGGSLYNNVNDDAVPVSDELSAGGGFGLRVGVRFATYFGLNLLFERYALGHDAYPHVTAGGEDIGVDGSRSAQHFGASFLARTASGKWGGFGEVGFTVENWTADLTASAPSLGDCAISDSLSGTSVRLGAGAIMPVSSWLELSPFLTVSAGSFSDRTVEACEEAESRNWVLPESGGIDDSLQAGHTLVLFGMGGDLLW